MGDKERWAKLAKWILDHLDTWKRMCQSGEVERLPQEHEAEEAYRALEELYELQYIELIIVYFSLNMGIVGEGVLRFVLKQFSDPEKGAEMEEMARKIIDMLKNRMSGNSDSTE